MLKQKTSRHQFNCGPFVWVPLERPSPSPGGTRKLHIHLNVSAASLQMFAQTSLKQKGTEKNDSEGRVIVHGLEFVELWCFMTCLFFWGNKHIKQKENCAEPGTKSHQCESLKTGRQLRLNFMDQQPPEDVGTWILLHISIERLDANMVLSLWPPKARLAWEVDLKSPLKSTSFATYLDYLGLV